MSKHTVYPPNGRASTAWSRCDRLEHSLADRTRASEAADTVPDSVCVCPDTNCRRTSPTKDACSDVKLVEIIRNCLEERCCFRVSCSLNDDVYLLFQLAQLARWKCFQLCVSSPVQIRISSQRLESYFRAHKNSVFLWNRSKKVRITFAAANQVRSPQPARLDGSLPLRQWIDHKEEAIQSQWPATYHRSLPLITAFILTFFPSPMLGANS